METTNPAPQPEAQEPNTNNVGKSKALPRSKLIAKKANKGKNKAKDQRKPSASTKKQKATALGLIQRNLFPLGRPSKEASTKQV